ncbi:Na(+)/H(+) antiporter subunit B [Alkalibacter saccharofermentans]|uniref:Uncharacterized MnhB-related membrane protein n=1 Tax=Alkalibacter saccharofermentans DSM 14828 TaxID=1120975 RepID=A0A1M4YU58_9FIRM|nr:DUF4040 domain-containing protein [Alkalibacter saccharofermentans]SHF09273.1 Uncharacterized MnhB-related membrane protein [Alkalibacter saccharofermentans DSM 14828]
MIEKIFLVLMVILAVITLNTVKLRRAVIYLGIFSLVSSFVYLLYGAPDVAIAEAVIGSALSTVLYLVALKKYQVFTIYYTNENYNEIHDGYIIKGRAQILKDVERFFLKREMEPQIIYTTENCEHVLDTKNFDLLIHQDYDTVIMFGCREDYHVDAMEDYVVKNPYENLTVEFVRFEAGDQIDS